MAVETNTPVSLLLGFRDNHAVVSESPHNRVKNVTSKVNSNIQQLAIAGGSFAELLLWDCVLGRFGDAMRSLPRDAHMQG